AVFRRPGVECRLKRFAEAFDGARAFRNRDRIRGDAALVCRPGRGSGAEVQPADSRKCTERPTAEAPAGNRVRAHPVSPNQGDYVINHSGYIWCHTIRTASFDSFTTKTKGSRDRAGFGDRC